MHSMTEDKTYNGWANYATWGVALVLDNDEGTYNYVREMSEDVRRDAPNDPNSDIWTIDQTVRFKLADRLKDFTEELCGLGDSELGIPEPSMMAQQLLGAAMSDVNWDEIAGHYVED